MVTPQTSGSLGPWADASSLDEVLFSDGTIETHHTSLPGAPDKLFFRLQVTTIP